MFIRSQLKTEGDYIIRTHLINVLSAGLRENHPDQVNWIIGDQANLI